MSLADYLDRMTEGQDKIYYLTGESYSQVRNSPHLEVFRKKGVEVLLLTDRIDEWLMSYLNEFDGKAFVDVARGDLDLVVTSDPLDLAGITYVPLFTYEAMLAVANQHPLASKPYIVPQDLIEQTLITYPVERLSLIHI